MYRRTLHPAGLIALFAAAAAAAAAGLALAGPVPAAAAAGAAAAGAAAAAPWTLERVLDLVREEDPGVRAARAAARAGRAEAGAAFSSLSPRLRVEAGLLRTDDPAILFSEKLWQGRFTASDFDLGALNHPAPANALEAGLVLEQPLFNGGAEVTAPAMARGVREAAAGAGEARVAAELLGAVETYVGAVRARGALAADSLGEEAAREEWRSAVELYRKGQVPEMDTLRAAARWGEARVAWLEARKESAVALARLGQLLGAPVASGEIGGLPDLQPAAEAQMTADHRGELRAATARAHTLDLESRRAGLGLLPTLNSRFTLTHYRSLEDGEGERRWTAGLAFSLPVWDGAERARAWQAARARAEAARAEAASLRRDLVVAAEAAREGRAIAFERRAVTLAARAAAEEALRFAAARYRAGLLAQTDLLAADAEAARARWRQVDAEAEVVLAHYRYLHAIGELR